jgi:O-methyltransferase involved in polyketide biosynthesis
MINVSICENREKSAWILEGLTMYLHEGELMNLLAAIARLTPFESRIGVRKLLFSQQNLNQLDLFNLATLHGPLNRAFTQEWEKWGAPLVWGTNEPELALKKVHRLCARL